MIRLTPVVKNLMIINAAMLLLTYLLQGMDIDLYQIFGLYYFKSEYFQPLQFVTHMFMHGNFLHLFFNMYALYLFGSVLETVWGSKRFFIYYITTGLGAALIHTAVNWYMINDFYQLATRFIENPTYQNFRDFVIAYPEYFDPIKVKQILSNWKFANIVDLRTQVNAILEARLNIPTVGASGAVFGILIAFGLMFPRVPLYLFFIPIPIPAKYFVIGYGILELISGILTPGDGIAHFAHLGGMIFGYIILRIWYGSNINRH